MGKEKHQPLVNPVAAVRIDASREKVASRRGALHADDMVERGIGSRCRRRQASGVDDGRAPLLDDLDELLAQPSVVAYDVVRWTPFNARILGIRVLRGAVVAPDGHIGHRRDLDSGLLGKLGLGAVLIQPGHRVEAVAGDTGPMAVAHSNQAISISWIAHHQDPHIRGGSGKSLTLADEYRAIFPN